MPGHAVITFHENFNFDFEMKSTLVLAKKDSNDLVPASHNVVGEVDDIVRCEVIANRVEVSVRPSAPS